MPGEIFCSFGRVLTLQGRDIERYAYWKKSDAQSDRYPYELVQAAVQEIRVAPRLIVPDFLVRDFFYYKSPANRLCAARNNRLL